MTCLYFWWLQNTGKQSFEKRVKMISALRTFLVILYITGFSRINNNIIFKHLKFDDHKLQPWTKPVEAQSKNLSVFL